MGVAAVLIALNVARYTGEATETPTQTATAVGSLPVLPELSVAADFQQVPGPPARNLFRVDAPKVPEPAPEPETVPEPDPAPDPDARLRAEADSALDSFRVIGFLSTGEGIVAVLNSGGSVVNAFKGDRPAPGIIVSDITIDSVTLEHVELGLKRTYGLDDAD